MSATPSIIQDAVGIHTLLSPPPDGNVLDARFKMRRLGYMSPYISSYKEKMAFDMIGIASKLVTFENGFLYFGIILKAAAAFQALPFPTVAFKGSILSAIIKVMIKSANSSELTSQTDDIALSNHLRLLEMDEDWLKTVGADIHFSLDRCAPGSAGLTSDAKLRNPCISKYGGSPAIGVAAAVGPVVDPVNKNFDNLDYNLGFHERNEFLVRACHKDDGTAPAWNGTELKFTARIPLRLLSDCMRAICDSGPMQNDRLQFEFYVNQNTSPVTIGSVGPGNVQVAGGDVRLSIDPDVVPRMYYEEIELRPDVAKLYAEAVASASVNRTLTWRDYNVQVDIADRKNKTKSGGQFEHTVTSSGVAVQRVWALCYPSDAGSKVTGTSWPGPLVTGPHGLTNVSVSVNGSPFYSNSINTPDEHYELLLNSAYMGSKARQCMIPFEVFRHISRVHCFDVSRAASLMSDPNRPCEIIIRATADSDVAVDVVYVVESLRSGTKYLSNGAEFQWTVGSALVKI